VLEEDDACLKRVLDLVFKNMLEISSSNFEDWCSPPDGFNDDLEEDDDQKLVKQSMDQVDRVIGLLGEEKMIPIYKDYITQLINQGTWQSVHAGIMTISQIGEYVDVQDELMGQFVGILQNYAQNENPRVRYAICHALGQFCDDLQVDFQNKYHQEIMKIVLPYMKDPVPRVVAHAMACLTNFLEFSKEEYLVPNFQFMFDNIIAQLNNNILFVKEGCLSALSALAEGAKQTFKPFYDQIMQLVLRIFSNSSDKACKQLRGNAVECVTIIAKVYPKEMFGQYLDGFVKALVQVIVSGVDNEGSDVQKSFILSAFQRMTICFGEMLAPYLEQFVPLLLKMALAPVVSAEDDLSQNTSVTEDINIAIQLVNVFLSKYANKMAPLSQNVYEMITLVVRKIKNVEIKLQTLGLFYNLIKIAKATSNPNFKDISREAFNLIWKEFIYSSDGSYKSEYAYQMQEILAVSGDIFSEQQLMEFLQKCELELGKSEERRKKILENFDPEEMKQKMLEFHVKIEHGAEDDLKLEIANLFGSIFKSHKQLALQFLNRIYANHIVPCFQSNPDLNNIEYGLFLIDDSIEHMGEFLSQEQIQFYYQVLFKYQEHTALEIKQSSSFGLGILSKYLGANVAQVFQPLMQRYQAIMELTNEKKTFEITFQSCLDNAKSAFIRTLEANWGNLNEQQKNDFVVYWVSKLPCVADADESKACMSSLLKLLNLSPMMILGQ
jgi:hypothetical protein